MSSTICAIATPAGGAIGIVRVSGSQAISITSSLFRPQGGKPLTERKGGTLSFGHIVAPTTGEIVDEVLVSLFRAPHSYTGEDATEISCHGSAYILGRVVELLLNAGCTMAQPGEYTQRAFLNGKMDLSQAEAVADLIASTTAANHRMAMQQLRGTFSQKLNELRDKLLHLTSLMELELDFSDHEELEFADRSELLTIATDAESHISRLCDSFRLGNALKRGVPVAIVGETNAGKSTLLNALVGEERALVSNVHGTTRDTVEESVNLDGTLVRFIDTAGIRDTSDEVERMGIERTFRKIAEADVVVWLLDATYVDRQFAVLSSRLLAEIAGKELLVAVNKVDIAPDWQKTSSLSLPDGTPLIAISAQCDADVSRLRTLLAETLRRLTAQTHADDVIVSNARHYEALCAAREALQRVIDGLHTNLSGDFVSQDLRETLHHLSSIVGEITSDDVLQNIFHHFCIGK